MNSNEAKIKIDFLTKKHTDDCEALGLPVSMWIPMHLDMLCTSIKVIKFSDIPEDKRELLETKIRQAVEEALNFEPTQEMLDFKDKLKEAQEFINKHSD